MLDASQMISKRIPDHVFVKRKVLLAKDAGDDDQGYLKRIGDFYLIEMNYCETICSSSIWQ